MILLNRLDVPKLHLAVIRDGGKNLHGFRIVKAVYRVKVALDMVLWLDDLLR